jgi:large subunit ribosomal protein L17
MRHRKKISKLNRTSAHRKALMRNLLDSLISQGRIETTIAKAKELKRFADNFFSKVRKNDLNAKKRAGRYLKTRESFKKLFEEDFIDFLNSRNGGYVRVVRSGIRPGDTAQLAIIELTGKYEPETKKPETEDRGSRLEVSEEGTEETTEKEEVGGMPSTNLVRGELEVSEEGKTEEEKIEEKPEEITTEDTEKEEEINPEAEPPSENPEEKE